MKLYTYFPKNVLTNYPNKILSLLTRISNDSYVESDGTYNYIITKLNEHKFFEDFEKLAGKKVYRGDITELGKNQIFVFGSNTNGFHSLGTAKIAKEKYGAVYGQSRGIQGQSYAIITKDLTLPRNKPSRTRLEITGEINCLYSFAIANRDLDFLIAYRARTKNLNFYSSEELALMFSRHIPPTNVIFEESFAKLVYDKGLI